MYVCQQIIFNSKSFVRPSRTKDTQDIVSLRHERSAECPTTHYMTIELYIIVRSKTLIQLLFSFGIVLSYDRIKSFLNELSQSVKVLYNDSDNKVLPSKLRNYLFTIFVMIMLIRTVHPLMQIIISIRSLQLMPPICIA